MTFRNPQQCLPAVAPLIPGPKAQPLCGITAACFSRCSAEGIKDATGLLSACTGKHTDTGTDVDYMQNHAQSFALTGSWFGSSSYGILLDIHIYLYIHTYTYKHVWTVSSDVCFNRISHILSTYYTRGFTDWRHCVILWSKNKATD